MVDYEDVYSTANLTDELKIKTHYEALDIAQSNRVHYLQFKIDKTLPIEEDETLKNLFREKVVGEQRFLF